MPAASPRAERAGRMLRNPALLRRCQRPDTRPTNQHLSSRRIGPMDPKLDRQTIAKAYARWAPVYDLVFGPVFERGRQAAIVACDRIGGRVLEVGVGTGISLPDY